MRIPVYLMVCKVLWPAIQVYCDDDVLVPKVYGGLEPAHPVILNGLQRGIARKFAS